MGCGSLVNLLFQSERKSLGVRVEVRGIGGLPQKILLKSIL